MPTYVRTYVHTYCTYVRTTGQSVQLTQVLRALVLSLWKSLQWTQRPAFPLHMDFASREVACSYVCMCHMYVRICMYVRMYACTYFSSSSFCICLQDRRHQISGSLRPKTCSPMSYVHCQAKVQKWPPRGKRLYVRKKPNLHPLFSQVLTMSRLRSTRGIVSASTYVCRYISQRAIDAAIIVVYLRMHVYSQTTYVRIFQGAHTYLRS